jgi:triphosphoribosyl-dephospho-CoA synthase
MNAACPAPTLPAASAFLEACRLDVAVRKPGNVSQASPGHGMDADCFLRSAAAAAVPLFAAGEGTGARIEAAVEASFDAAGCNTNLGIVLLGAPIAAALERLCRPTRSARSAPQVPRSTGPAVLRAAVVEVLESLTVDDARAAYRAIARASPAGLGRVEHQDVRHEPFIDLRSAMSLAAERDSIARQYDNGFADLFELGVPAFNAVNAGGMRGDGKALAAAVQRTYLTYLARWPDSHLVRKHGPATAHAVMLQARAWLERSMASLDLDAEPDFAAWDEALKAQGLNPGTSADLTVATSFLCGLLRGGP